MKPARAQRIVARSRALRAARRAVAHAARFGPNDDFAAFARFVVARGAATLAAQRPAPGKAPTPDAIHDLRVAARRLRVALKLARRVLPAESAARLRAELKHFAAALADARDLDVHAAGFRGYAQELSQTQRAELRDYASYLRRERAQARRRAAAACASARTAALFAELERLASASADSTTRSASRTIRDAARTRIRRGVRRVCRLGNELARRSRPGALHRLRIKTKRLRYELEFFTEALPGLAAATAACKALQDVLGAHQDARVADALLRRYAASLRARRGPRTLPPALEALRRSQLAEARAQRRTFRQRWPAFAAALDAARRVAG